jgi:hypothetical protein
MPRQGKTRIAACALAVLGLLMTAGDAMAQSDGVFVDPDTPAGKEYALPLDKARQDAAPNSGTQGSESGDTELFGAGISKRDGGGGRGDGQGSGAATGDRGGDGKASGSSQSDAAVDPRSVAKAAASSGSGISSGWLTALIAAGVLLVGGIAGLSLRALRAT